MRMICKVLLKESKKKQQTEISITASLHLFSSRLNGVMVVCQILDCFKLNSYGRNNSRLDFQTKIDATYLKSAAATLVFLNK